MQKSNAQKAFSITASNFFVAKTHEATKHHLNRPYQFNTDQILIGTITKEKPIKRLFGDLLSKQIIETLCGPFNLSDDCKNDRISIYSILRPKKIYQEDEDLHLELELKFLTKPEGMSEYERQLHNEYRAELNRLDRKHNNSNKELKSLQESAVIARKLLQHYGYNSTDKDE